MIISSNICQSKPFEYSKASLSSISEDRLEVKSQSSEQTRTRGGETGLLGRILSGQSLSGQRTCRSSASQKEGGSISSSRGR